MLADQFCDFQLQDQTTGTKLHSKPLLENHRAVNGMHRCMTTTSMVCAVAIMACFSECCMCQCDCFIALRTLTMTSGFTMQRPMVWRLWKLGAHERKGAIKMRHDYCNNHSHSLFPYPFFPSCACNFKRSKEPEEVLCILIWRWFFRSHRGRLLTGSSAQWSPKAKVIIEVLPPAKGGRWKALNFLRARKNCLLPELRKTHEK